MDISSPHENGSNSQSLSRQRVIDVRRPLSHSEILQRLCRGDLVTNTSAEAAVLGCLSLVLAALIGAKMLHSPSHRYHRPLDKGLDRAEGVVFRYHQTNHSILVVLIDDLRHLVGATQCSRFDSHNQVAEDKHEGNVHFIARGFQAWLLFALCIKRVRHRVMELHRC